MVALYCELNESYMNLDKRDVFPTDPDEKKNC